MKTDSKNCSALVGQVHRCVDHSTHVIVPYLVVVLQKNKCVDIDTVASNNSKRQLIFTNVQEVEKEFLFFDFPEPSTRSSGALDTWSETIHYHSLLPTLLCKEEA